MMLVISRLAITGLFLSLLALGACTRHIGLPPGAATATAQNGEFTRLQDLRFSPDGWPQSLLADLYLPQRTPPPGGFPAVLLIHGGAWARGDREQVASIGRRIAERGYAVMNLTYRFAPEHLFPAQVQDVQQAVLWLRTHAAGHRIDPQRMAAWGYSAGAHLAGMLAHLGPGDALFVEGTRMQALVAGGTPADLRKFTGGYLVPRFLGTSFQENPQRFAEASPEVYVTPDDPPTFQYHGTWDSLVPLDQATDYRKALDAAGIQNELFLIRNLGHIAAFFADGAAVQAGLDFLDRQLALPPQTAGAGPRALP